MTAVKVIRFLVGEATLGGDLHARWAGAVAARPDADAPTPGDAPAGGPSAGGVSVLPSSDRRPSIRRSSGGSTATPAAAGGALTGTRSPVGRPWRVALCEPLSFPGLPEAPFAAVDIQWFADEDDAAGNDGWLRSAEPGLCIGGPGPIGPGSLRVVAEEVAPRGSDYLRGRWETGGARYKMMSFGRRHPSLTAAQFSERWRGHAGRLGGEEIPEEARGLAYIQNHPVPPGGHEWPLDAVNEVYFERLDHLALRRDWFAARRDMPRENPPPPFMSPTETWSMFVREHLLTPPAG